MPVELSDLLGNERWIEVEVGDALLQVAYRPGVTSLRHQAEIQKQARMIATQTDTDETEQVAQLGEIFCEMVCGWDLTEGGKPLPITPDVVTGRLPGAIFNAIMIAIGADGRGQDEEKKALSATSEGGLRQVGRPAIAQNGTPTLEPQSTWASRRGNS